MGCYSKLENVGIKKTHQSGSVRLHYALPELNEPFRDLCVSIVKVCNGRES